MRYYIINGDPNEDFHLDQLTGKLSVSRGLDYERLQSYTLTVQVSVVRDVRLRFQLGFGRRNLELSDCFNGTGKLE